MGSDSATISFNYDNNGNLLSKELETVTDISVDPMTIRPGFGSFVSGQDVVGESALENSYARYTYNNFNQMVAAQTGDARSEYKYNGAGVRTYKEVGGVKTYSMYQGLKAIYEVEVDGLTHDTSVNMYAGNKLVSVFTSGTETKLLYDGLGSVVGYYDVGVNDYGDYRTYNAFGELEENGIANDTLDIGYRGYQLDSETELYNLNARMYDADLARFMQEDTYLGKASDPLSLNLYAYVSSNPLRYWDPTGRIQAGDEYFSYDVQEQLASYTEQYYAATTDAEKKAVAKAAADLRASNRSDYNSNLSQGTVIQHEVVAAFNEQLKETEAKGNNGEKYLDEKEWKSVQKKSTVSSKQPESSSKKVTDSVSKGSVSKGSVTQTTTPSVGKDSGGIANLNTNSGGDSNKEVSVEGYDFGYVEGKVRVFRSYDDIKSNFYDDYGSIESEYFLILEIVDLFAKIEYLISGGSKIGHILTGDITSFYNDRDIVEYNHPKLGMVDAQITKMSGELYKDYDFYQDPFKFFAEGTDPMIENRMEMLVTAGRKTYGGEGFKITAYYGEYYSNGLHEGTDFNFSDSPNHKIYSIGKGTVSGVVGHGSFNHFYIEYLDGIFANYQHSSSIKITSGQDIRNGTYLGNQGRRGLKNKGDEHVHMQFLDHNHFVYLEDTVADDNLNSISPYSVLQAIFFSSRRNIRDNTMYIY